LQYALLYFFQVEIAGGLPTTDDVLIPSHISSQSLSGYVENVVWQLQVWYGFSVSEISCPGHMPHSCGQVPATRQLSAGQLDILEHETKQYTPNDLLDGAAVHQRSVGYGQPVFLVGKSNLRSGCPGTTTPLLDFRNPGLHLFNTLAFKKSEAIMSL
jgi:hypothetical protein